LSAYFVVPDCCVCFIQFPFDVFILVDSLCLFGTNKFNVHGPVRRNNNIIIIIIMN
jgi:hypothetical protein